MKSSAHQLTWRVLAALILGTFLTALFISHTGPLRQLELKITDQLFKIRGPLTIQDSTLALVSISQSADAEIPYKYPWPTHFYAKLIENLNKAGAKAIGFDVIFDKQDLYNLKNDSLFARAIHKYGNVVLAGNVHTRVRYRGRGSSSSASTMVQPNETLTDANPNPLGLVNILRDADNQIRQYPLYLSYNHHRYYSLALELLRIYNGWKQPKTDGSNDYFTFGSYKIPRFGEQTMSINYFGGPSTFPTHSFDMVIDDTTVTLASEQAAFPTNSFSNPDYGLLANEVFKDKIVLVGATMPTLNDFHSAPFASDGSLPGYEIHANAIQTILTGKYLYHLEAWIQLIVLLLLSAIVVITIQKSSVRLALVQFALLVAAILVAVVVGFLQFDYILPITGPLLAGFTGYLSTLSYSYISEQKEKRRIQSLFSTYLSPSVVNEMVESGVDPRLGGMEQNITAFFSDIESFSTFSEELSAPKLVQLMNEYLSAMTNILTEHGGTLDKYIGDAIVAFFGAPVSYQDHAYKACLVSQLMQLELSELRRKWKKEGEKWPQSVHSMRMRIGINTGKMLTGNMGSKSRFNYTIMGDNVNLTARCESAAKHYGVYTMVTAQTKRDAEQFGDECVFRYLDRIVVKGKHEPVDVYEIIGLCNNLTEQQWKCKSKFEEARQAYQNREWDRAQQLFEESAQWESHIPEKKKHVRTNPSLLFIDRCKKMKINPPSADWNAVYIMKSK